MVCSDCNGLVQYISATDSFENFNYNLFCGNVIFYKSLLQNDSSEETEFFELSLNCRHDLNRKLELLFCQGRPFTDEEVVDYMEVIAFTYYFDWFI